MLMISETILAMIGGDSLHRSVPAGLPAYCDVDVGGCANCSQIKTVLLCEEARPEESDRGVATGEPLASK